jgi:hypothetical protein
VLAFFIAAIVANAFIVLRYSPTNFYKLHRYDGQLLYIKATFIGVTFTAASYLLSEYFGVVDRILNSFNLKELQIFSEGEHLEAFFIFFLFAVFISYVYCGIERLVLFFRVILKFRSMASISYYRQMVKILLMHKILRDSPLDNLFFLSYVQNKFLLITMSDRKVYVGRVISLGEPNESEGPDQEISIVPVFSGYRDKDSLTVTLNTTYVGTDEIDDIYLVLKQDNIISACEFVESLYQKFSSTEES